MIKVLYFESDPFLHRVVERTLERDGFEVVHFTHLDQAKEYAVKPECDVAVFLVGGGPRGEYHVGLEWVRELENEGKKVTALLPPFHISRLSETVRELTDPE